MTGDERGRNEERKKCGKILFYVVLAIIVTKKNTESEERNALFKSKSTSVYLLNNSLAFCHNRLIYTMCPIRFVLR